MKHKITLLLLLAYAPIAFSQPIDSNYKNYNQPKPSPGVLLRTTATEICNNHIDDDNNGLTDENDFACYFNGLTPTACKQSSILWVASANRDLYWVDISTGAQHNVGMLPIALVDITWASNGKLYGCSTRPDGIWKIDPYTANAQFIQALPLSNSITNSMTADAAGNLYFTGSLPGGERVFRLHIASGEVCTIANLTAAVLSPAGDLTFLNGKLYLTCMNNLMATIDVRTGKITKQPFINSTTNNYYGLASLGDGYLYVCHLNDIYKVDPATMVVSNSPTITLQGNRGDMYGMASYNELCQAPTCLAKTSIEAASNPPYCISLGVQLKGNVTPLCDVNLSAISWTTADGITVPGDKVKAVTPGKYYLNFKTTTETCNRMDSFTLQYAPNTPLAVDTSYLLPIGCTCTGTMTVIAGCGSGNYKYEWSTGATTATISNGCPGHYTVKVTDVDWLKDTTIQFNIPPPATGIQRADITVSGDHCEQNDGIITITHVQGGTSPYQYALNNQPFGSGSTFAPLPKGYYTITIHDNAGCSLQEQVAINDVPGPQKLWYTQKDAFCGLPGGTVIIDSIKNGSPPYSFAIDNVAFSQQTTWTNISPGQHIMTIKDNYGCLYNEPFTILQSEALKISISPKDTTMCASEKINFRAIVLGNNEGVQFAWDNGRFNTANTFKSSIYADKKMVVLATDKYGCTATDTAAITARYCDTLFANCVRFPNAFSPNRDGVNDMFGARHGSCEIKNYNLTIYNRWGQRVFQAKDIFQRWNGTINGQDQLTDTYVYSCVWQDALGFVHTLKGTVVLIR